MRLDGRIVVTYNSHESLPLEVAVNHRRHLIRINLPKDRSDYEDHFMDVT